MKRVFELSSAIQKFEQSSQYINSLFGADIHFAFVAGSGLSSLTQELNIIKEINYSDIPGLFSSTVKGHSGTLQLVENRGIKCLFFSGRVHFYEGFSVIDTLFPIIISYHLGIKNMIISNAVGGLNINYKVGDLMLIESTINLMNRHVVDDVHIEGNAVNLNNKFKSICTKNGIDYTCGNLATVTGPTYETPAEIRAFRIMGADAMGMSTTLELKSAEMLKMNTLGISLITNKLKETSTLKLSHDEVILAANLAEQKLKSAFLSCFELFEESIIL